MLTTATSSRARNAPVGNTCSASTTAWIDLGGTSGDVRGSASTQPGGGVRRGGDREAPEPTEHGSPDRDFSAESSAQAGGERARYVRVDASLVHCSYRHFASRRGCLMSGAPVVFSALVVRNVSRGLAGSCNCFGRFHSSKIGWWTILRNVVLISISALIVVASDLAVSLLVNGLDLDQPARLARMPRSQSSPRLPSLCSCAVVLLRGRGGEPVDNGSIRRRDRRRSPSATNHRPDPASTPVVLLGGRVTTLGDTLAGDAGNILVFIDPACGPVPLTAARFATPVATNGRQAPRRHAWTRGPQS